MKKYIAYYRCSTSEQGRSGLGLDAQKFAVEKFVKGNGLLIKEYVEVETGTNKRCRIEINDALQLAKKEKATLVIAKLDRLARNVHFVSSLMESGVDFVACDMPTANNFTIHIFAALAEQEAKLISERTRSALASLKERGVKLGTPQNLTSEARKKGAVKRVENAKSNPHNVKARAMALLLKEKGLTLAQVADRLNVLGYETRRRLKFRPETVRRLLNNKSEPI